MYLESIRTGINVARVMQNPDTFKDLLIHGQLNDKEVQNSVDLVVALGKNKILRITTALFLSGTPNTLANTQRIGVALFTGFVTLIDEELDKKDCPRFQSEVDLTNYLLSRNVQIGNKNLSLNELYNITLNHFPEHKQQEIIEFATNMIRTQIQCGNHKKIGEYGFQEIQEYKELTNRAYGQTALFLAENKSKTMAKFPDATLAIQMFDDAWDWPIDSENETENLLVGMAMDVWVKKGCPPNEDLGFMISELKKGITIDPRKFIRSPQMKSTREAFQKEFEARLKKMKGFSYKNFLAFEWNYIMGMKSPF